MNYDDRIRLNIFRGSTTYLDDYRKYNEIYKITPNYSRAQYEDVKPKPKPMIQLDQETFIPLRKKIPMNLMMIPNDLTRGNPHREIQHIILPEDEKKTEVMKTRPRVICSPQVSMDDLPNSEMRELLVDYMYTTDFKRAEQELVSMVGIESRNVPDRVLEHDRFLPKNKKHYFSVFFKPKPQLLEEMTLEKNEQGAKWTRKQLVATTNPTENFWKNKDVKCGACHNPVLNLVEKKTKQQIRELIDKNWIRMPHDKKCPGYAGFAPEKAVGMGLARKDLPCDHPLLSISQVVARRKLTDTDIPRFD